MTKKPLQKMVRDRYGGLSGEEKIKKRICKKTGIEIYLKRTCKN